MNQSTIEERYATVTQPGRKVARLYLTQREAEKWVEAYNNLNGKGERHAEIVRMNIQWSLDCETDHCCGGVFSRTKPRIELAAVVVTMPSEERYVAHIASPVSAAAFAEKWNAWAMEEGNQTVAEVEPVDWRLGDNGRPIEPLPIGLFVSGELVGVEWKEDPRIAFCETMNEQTAKMPSDRRVVAAIITNEAGASHDEPEPLALAAAE